MDSIITKIIAADYEDHKHEITENKISVTTLIGNLKVAEARRRGIEMYYTENDLMNSWLGTAGHDRLETNARKLGFKTPTKVQKKIKVNKKNYIIYGTPDFFHEKTLYDYKFMNVWKKLVGSIENYVWQINIYNWLMGMKFDELKLEIFYTNWAAKDAESKRSYKNGIYPPNRWEEISIEKKADVEIEAFLEERLLEWEFNQKLSNEELLEMDLCTDEEKFGGKCVDNYCPLRYKCQWAIKQRNKEDKE